jgi:outer membrane protein
VKWSVLSTFLVMGLVLCSRAGLANPNVEDVRLLTLPEALEIGLYTHPSLTRRREEARAEDAVVNRVASDAKFKVFLEAAYKQGVAGQPNFSFPGIIQGSLDRYTSMDGYLVQPYDFGRTRFRTRAQRHTADAAHAEENTQLAKVALRVVQTYYDLLRTQAVEQLEQNNVDARATVARYADIRFRNGAIARVDVGLALASLAEARVRLIRSHNDVLQAFATLENAMGVSALPAYRVEEPPMLASDRAILAPGVGVNPLGGSLEQDVRKALDQRPEMATLRARVEASADSVRAAAAGHRPTLRLIASSGIIKLAKPTSDDNYAFGVAFSVPIFSGGLIEADTEEARHRLSASSARELEQADDIRLEVTRARLLVGSLLEARQASAERVAQSADSEHLARLRYQHGIGTFIDLQQAQLALLSAYLDETRLRYDTLTAFYSLRYARGEILDQLEGNI